ncbi:MAG TPA: heme-binding protein [Actinomycetes bacterium]|jgi:uncharacterized protein GlcG (DUF336 family)|nr:heme-binding protein [Actinomycetes bacterium]
MDLSLEAADTIADGALARGRELGCQPLAVAVLDAGGHAKVVKRQDGAGILRGEIAIGKAWGALGMGLPSRELEQRASTRPEFFAAISGLAGGRVIPAAGGVLVLSEDGAVIGAVGVSGDTADRDEDCALRGIAAVGLSSNPPTGK